MSELYDHDAMLARYWKEDGLRKEGKRCTGCRWYEKYPVAGKGRASGFCRLSKERYPDKPAWWGKARNHVCADYEEVTDDGS